MEKVTGIEVQSKKAKSTEEVAAELKAQGIEPKVSKPNKSKKSDKAKVEQFKKEVQKSEKAKAEKKSNTTGLVTVKDLEAEFGIKAKVIRRHLRKMEESTKARGPERYEWEVKSPELKAIRTKLATLAKKSA